MSEVATAGRLERGVTVVSIVASLLFVGYEIRQNTKAATAGAIQEVASLTLQCYLTAATDPDLGPLLLETARGAVPSDFTPSQNAQMRLFYAAGLSITESRFRQADLGVIPGDAWFGSNNAGLRSAYLREMWPSIRESQAPDFVEYMSRQYGLDPS